jgi:hypothetical protein
MKTLLIALTAALCLATVAGAEITVDQLERAAQCLAFSASQPRLKKLCVCQDGSANHYHIGYVSVGMVALPNFKYHLTMTCHVPSISTVDGSISGSQNCLTYDTLVD